MEYGTVKEGKERDKWREKRPRNRVSKLKSYSVRKNQLRSQKEQQRQQGDKEDKEITVSRKRQIENEIFRLSQR